MSARLLVVRRAARAGTVRLCRVVALLAALTSPMFAQVGPLTILDHIRVDPRKPIDFHAAAYPETLYHLPVNYLLIKVTGVLFLLKAKQNS